jgi:hypothetical protein
MGVVSKPTYTGWMVDYCGDDVPVPSLPQCAQIGGEIYRATLSEVRTLEGNRISQRFIIGFTGHALPKHYRDTKRLCVEKAPDDFRAATGIEYLVRRWSDTSASLERARGR